MEESKRLYKRHTYAERLHAVELYHQGLSSTKVAAQLGLDPSMVRAWIRKYRAYGTESLCPYWRAGKSSGPQAQESSFSPLWDNREKLFGRAYQSYATTQHSVASIARHYGLDYHSFKYHVERYHPELVAARARIHEQY